MKVLLYQWGNGNYKFRIYQGCKIKKLQICVRKT